MSNLLEPIVQAVVSLVGALGAPGVGIAVAAENLFPPIPSEVILPSAGFAAASGSMGLVSAIVWATIGSVAGALALYALGAWFGRARFYSLAAKIPFVKEADIKRAEAWFVRRGPLAVLLGRIVPVVRSLISIPAGIERMKLLPFTCTRQLVPRCGIRSYRCRICARRELGDCRRMDFAIPTYRFWSGRHCSGRVGGQEVDSPQSP